jgi:tetratricopeptide (TPR) repeat protein
MRRLRVRVSLTLWRLLIAVVLILCMLAAVPRFRSVTFSTVRTLFGPSTSQAAQATPATFLQAARRAIAHGHPAEAEALAKARPANDSDTAAVLARVAIARGKYDDALKMLEPAAAAQPTGEAALELGLLLRQRLGRVDAGIQHLTRIYQRGSQVQDAESLFRAARAAHALGQMQDANAIYRAASRGGSNPAIETGWGELFLETNNLPEALKSFQQVIKADGEWAPAHLGIAQTLDNENPTSAAAAAQRALEIDPQLAGAQLFLAEADLDSTKYDAAREKINQVLETNPSDLDARALLGAIAYVRGDTATFDAEVRRILAVNPAFGEAYRVAGDLAARNYRFDEAVALTRKALSLDASNVRAGSDLGLQLMRTGDEPEARRVLDRTFKAFPFDTVTFNLLGLLDKLEKFEIVQEGDLVFKFHPDEARVLREYAIPLAKDALKKLTGIYQFTPTGPILIEIFPQHDDFAVRTLGLPGMIGALGACFGRVVSLDSPRAKQPGDFSWQSTLWHELTHVITLQMSNQRVPRWLTEGISVYEEGRQRPAWARDMEVPFAIALERGQTLKLRDLNSGFTKSETIALAYYEASLVVDHILTTHGEEAMRRLLRTYGEGVEGEAAINKALGVTIDQLQTTFDKMLDQRFGSVRTALRDWAKPGDDRSNGDLAVLKAAAEERSGSYRAQLLYGAALAKQGDKAAFEPLEKASSLVPMAIGPESPHAIMGQLAEKLNDPARAIKEYTQLLENDHTAIEAARRLVELGSKANDPKVSALGSARIVELDPFDTAGHVGLGQVALKTRDAPTAIREFSVALSIGPPDRASAHCDLAESYLVAGRAADAKREALAALEIAPSFERAQDLLLKAIDGKQP